jgi:hypothetical protein
MDAEAGAGIVMILLMLAFAAIVLGIMVWSLVWTYGDAERRGKSGCLVALLVALFSWPFSLLMWIVFRPEDGAGSRTLDRPS